MYDPLGIDKPESGYDPLGINGESKPVNKTLQERGALGSLVGVTGGQQYVPKSSPEKKPYKGVSLGDYESLYNELQQDIPTPKSPQEFVANVPRSGLRNIVGAVEFIPRTVNAVSEGFNRALDTATSSRGTLSEAWQQFMEPISEVSEETRQFFGKPTGFYGAEEAKEAWLKDPVGSVMAVAPIVKGGLSAVKTAKGYVTAPKVETGDIRDNIKTEQGEYDPLGVNGESEYKESFTGTQANAEPSYDPFNINNGGKKRTKNSYDNIIANAANKYGVPEDLIKSVINTESGFKNGLVSKKGARGLMQIMPDTAKELGIADVMNPTQNIEGGVRYLAGLIDRYDGDVQKALAAYNWGMGRVDKYGYLKAPDAVRTYVDGILGNRSKYGPLKDISKDNAYDPLNMKDTDNDLLVTPPDADTYPGYREVVPDEVLPAGSEVKMDMSTGKNYVKVESPVNTGIADIESAIRTEQRNMILSDMQQSLKEGKNYGTEQVNYGGGWENRNIGTSNPDWLNEFMQGFKKETGKKVNKEEIQSVLGKLSDPNAKSLTDKQIDIRYHLENTIKDLQERGHFRNEAEAAHLEGKGYVREQGEIPAYNIDKGDQFIIDGEEFTAKEIDDAGNVILKDGVTKKVGPDEIVPFEAIKKNEGATQATDDFEFGLNQKQPFKEETSDLPGMSYEENFTLTGKGKFGTKPQYGKKDVTGNLFSEGEYAKRPNETKRSAADNVPPQTPEERAKYEERKRAIVEMPELVEIANNLMGKGNIRIREILSKKAASGVFRPTNEGRIDLKAEIFKDSDQATKTMAHEIGHLVDYLPDKDIKRGNILGRIASLKKYVDSLLEEYKDAPGKILTDADRTRLKAEAKALANESEQTVTETIYKEVPIFKTLGIDTELILDLMRGVSDRSIAPDLFAYLQRADGKTKAAIIRQAMKGVVDEQLKQFGQKVQVGTERIAETITKGGKKSTKAEIERRFNELLAEEIRKRKLFDKEVITDELKRLSQAWKPFDPAKNSKYTHYRNSSVELYADAFSVLMNDPELLRKEAPIFHKAFFNWLDQKPDVKTLYDEIQRRLESDTETLRTRQVNIRESFKRGEEAALAAERKRTAITKSGILSEIKKALIDVNTAAITRVKTAEKSGYIFEDVNNPRYWLEELPYISSKIAGHIFGIDARVINPLKKDGLAIDDIGEYMMLKRISTERAELANPLGHTKETAAKQLDNLRQQLGNKKFTKLEQHIATFRNERQGLIRSLEESKMYDRNLMNIIKNSENYATFDVTKYLEQRYGRGVSGHIYKQIGTVNEIRNPFIATILKDAALMRAVEVTKAKRSIVKMFIDNFYDEIKIAETRWNGKYHEPIESKDLNEGMVVFLEEGKPSAFYLPKDIADSFNRKPYEAGMVMRVWQAATKPLRAILVSHNPLWMVANTVKDFLGTVANVPGLSIPKLLKYYKDSFSEAWQDAIRGQSPEIVEEMLKKKMLVIDRQYDFTDASSGETALDRILQSYGKSNTEYQNKVVKPFLKVWDTFGNFGKFTERLGKISGYKYLTEQGIAEREISHTVRSRVGTPDIYRRGSLNDITNSIFLFSNVGKEGFRSSFESARLNPGSYTWKLVKYNIVPKVIYKTAKYGFLGTTLAAICSKVNPYDEENYTVVPLGLTSNNKAIYLTIPQSYTGQVISGLLWNIMEGKILGKGGAIDYGIGGQPYALNPYIGVGIDLVTYYMKGQNPYDYFKGRSVLSDQEFAAGGIEATQALGKYAWNELGGSMIYRTQPGVGIVEKQGTSDFEKSLKVFPLNVVGKFVKISNLGEKAEFQSTAQTVAQQEAKSALEAKRRIIESINESNGKLVPAKVKQLFSELRREEIIPKTATLNSFVTKYKRYQAKSEDSPIIDAISQAKTNLQKAEMIREYRNSAKPNEYARLKRQLLIEKLISPSTLQMVNALDRKGK